MYFGYDFSRSIINANMQRYLEETKSLQILRLQSMPDDENESNKLTDEDLSALAIAINSNTSLRSLSLANQTKLTDRGMQSLLVAIRNNPECRLKEINTEGITLSDETRSALKTTLQNTKTSPTHDSFLHQMYLPSAISPAEDETLVQTESPPAWSI